MTHTLYYRWSFFKGKNIVEMILSKFREKEERGGKGRGVEETGRKRIKDLKKKEEEKVWEIKSR